MSALGICRRRSPSSCPLAVGWKLRGIVKHAIPSTHSFVSFETAIPTPIPLADYCVLFDRTGIRAGNGGGCCVKCMSGIVVLRIDSHSSFSPLLNRQPCRIQGLPVGSLLDFRVLVMETPTSNRSCTVFSCIRPATHFESSPGSASSV